MACRFKTSELVAAEGPGALAVARNETKWHRWELTQTPPGVAPRAAYWKKLVDSRTLAKVQHEGCMCLNRSARTCAHLGAATLLWLARWVPVSAGGQLRRR